MAKGTQVNAIAVGAVGIGLAFVWSGIKGASVLTSLQEIITGKKPTGQNVHGIASQAGAAGTASGAVGPAGAGTPYCASVYGGPADHTGSRGYHGDALPGTMSYAELGMGRAMGGKPYRQKARISYQGKSVIAEKLDIGAGGPGCGGHVRGIDLWYETAAALGFNGLGVVTVEFV